ncbi:conserved hypothetical protein [Pediculus humanus corporis]|uniref:lysozyme n=1 Tax=Pediculus humanus subsp. corporis TaxID=121224 RepID=E0W1V9_PEDHC|nr:uncharacterized protein Phum_PHUM580020 [Pediculus humanus corporis]EEB19553.1 conserved hypothetical protein [Pediculus humanus corporis]
MVYILFVEILSLLALSQAVFVSNLDAACLKCICTASTGCDKNYECSPQGFCGPFFISRKYWEEADRVTLNSDPRYREDGHETCAKNYNCATKIVSNYMAKNGRDCNNDGITDCDDFAKIHFYGEARCENAIERTSYHDRYIGCMPPKMEDKFQKK